MNKQRRKDIEAVVKAIEDLRDGLASIVEQIETIRDDEQEGYDNLPESFQNGERGESAQAAIDALENAISKGEGFDFDALISSLEEAA